MSKESVVNKSFNSLFLLFFVFTNFLGIFLSSSLNLPLWLDSIGTMLGVYFLGVYAGVICIFCNILTLYSLDSFNYVSPVIGAFVVYATHLFKEKHRLDINAIMLFSAFIIFFSFLISVCINYISDRQITGNLWGNAIISFCRDSNINYVGLPLASFYLEFLDKLVCVIIFYVMNRFVISKLDYFNPSEDAHEKQRSEWSTNYYSLCAGIILVSLFSYATSVFATEDNSSGKETNLRLSDLMNYSVQETVFNQKNGLISGNLTSICTTSDGYIWIGTYAGLMKYDGTLFKRENGFEQIRNIKSMYADGEILWVGTTDQGLFSLKNGRVNLHLTVNDELLSDYVTGIASDDAGSLYVTTPSGMNILDRHDNGYKVRSVYRAGSFSDVSYGFGYVMAIDLNGVIHCFKDSGEVKKFIPPKLTHYTSLLCCEDDYLYVADSSDRISRFKKFGNDFVKVDEFYNRQLHGVESMFYSSLGNGNKSVFICSDSGIYYIKNNSIKKIETDSFNDSIDQGIRDFQGNLWFASSRLGLLRLYLPPVVMVPAVKNQVVNCITKWRDNYIIGTDDGLKVYSSDFSQNLAFAFTEILSGVRIRDVYVDRDDYLWVCTHGKGVYRIKDTVERFNEENGLFGNKARSILELDDSRILLSGASGLSIFDKKTGLLKTDNILKKNVTVLCTALGDKGEIYAGTNGNGIYVIRDNKLEKVITKKTGLVSDTILKLYPLKNSLGVIAVTGNGLCYVDSSNEVRELENFPFFNNYDIINIGKDKVAVTGSEGVFVVGLKDLVEDRPNYPVEHLDESYGFIELLTANSRNYMDGNMLFLASNDGVFVMNTDDYQHKDNIFKLRIGHVNVDGLPYDIKANEPLTIPRSSKKISIQPVVLNYTPENPYVGIRLEGVDDDFSYTKEKSLTEINYTNLAPGNYVFTMALFNSDFKRKSDILRFPFTKVSAFYDSNAFVTYFICVSCLIIAYLTFFIVKLWMQKIVDEKQHLLELAEQQIKMGDETIMTIAQALDARDSRTKSHSVRVAEYSVLIAKKLGFTDKQCANLRKIALLHDIGKIGIPDRILNKPERLTEEEYAIMKSHVTIGAEILKNFKSIDNLADGIRYHHERYDGRGYVLGLKGEAIPIIGRIISVADAFDAMSANRVYRDKLQIENVINEIAKGRGTQFDPKCADIMIELFNEGKIAEILKSS